jgi:hypothetical protein
MEQVLKGHFYRHYKGNVYEVLEIGLHTETEESVVIYRPKEGGQTWVRPLKMFLESVDTSLGRVPRFVEVSPSVT